MEDTILNGYHQALDTLEETGNYVCFEFADTSLGLYCDDPEVLSWVIRYFSGYYTPTQKKEADATIYLTQNPEMFGLLYSKIQAARQPGENEYSGVELPIDDKHILIFNSRVSKKSAPEKICYMSSPSERKLLISLTASLQIRQNLAAHYARCIIDLHMLQKGWSAIHAAACIRNGACIVIGGDKFAGKTSTLINLLTRPGTTHLVANDRLFLRGAGTFLEGYGNPRKSGLRVGTLLAIPKLQRWMDSVTNTFYPQLSREELHTIAATTPPEELKNRPERIVLISPELADALNIEIQPRTPVDIFLVVKYSPELSEAQLIPMEKEDFLSFATNLSLNIAKSEKFLWSFFDYNDQFTQEKMFALLSEYFSQVPILELRQNERTNDQAAALIDEYLSKLQIRSPQ